MFPGLTLKVTGSFSTRVFLNKSNSSDVVMHDLNISL